jgi:hypothetical protein
VKITVDTIIELAIEASDRLKASGTPTLSAVDTTVLLASTLQDTPVGIKVRTRAKPSPMKDDVTAMRAALRFHMGDNVNLHGPIMSATIVGIERYSVIDTTARMVSIILRGRSVGASAWSKAMGGSL